MAMAWIWAGMVLLSTVCALFTGQTAQLASSAMEGAQNAVTVCLSVAGALCLWNGVGALLRRSGAGTFLSRLLRPLLSRLFPAAFRDAQAADSISANVAANVLGLGNAATPMGIAAVKRMKDLQGTQNASDEMCRFIVLNTASVQLLPTTAAALRASAGAAAPFDILPAVWVTSILSVTVGLLAAKLCSLRR